jgi:hypothetical protein
MLFAQTVLHHGGVVLVDFATESRDGDLHVFAALRISNLKFKISHIRMADF